MAADCADVHLCRRVLHALCQQHQAYTAQAVIKYTYDAASEGLTPNGEPLDVSEIFSSTVVKEAIERLGYSVNVDTIRSGGTVTGITPAEVQTRQDALAEKAKRWRNTIRQNTLSS